ncbi:MAG: hypothetical protein Q8P93_01540 [bacterium]|nr:hypothetical protein [bacterium]
MEEVEIRAYLKILLEWDITEAIQMAASLGLSEAGPIGFYFNDVLVIVPPDSDLIPEFCDEEIRKRKTREIVEKYQKDLRRPC